MAFLFNMEEEIWKEVRDYEGIYWVSNKGRIRNRSKIIVSREKGGYKRISLSKSGKKRSFAVHRLVAFSFLPKPKEGRNEINHIDGVRNNNAPCNLEWCTRKENIKHAIEVTGNYTQHIGLWKKIKNKKQSELSRSDVLKIKKLLSEGVTGYRISKIFKVNTNTIYAIKRNQTHVNIN